MWRPARARVSQSLGEMLLRKECSISEGAAGAASTMTATGGKANTAHSITTAQTRQQHSKTYSMRRPGAVAGGANRRDERRDESHVATTCAR